MTEAARTKQEAIVGVFDRAAATYDRVGPQFFTHFGKRLVDSARLVPGQEVLDVATGRGAVLFAAVERVGPSGRVRGIDFSADMVRETMVDIRTAGWQHVTMQQMDAEQLDFEAASFDAVLCGFALWFFPHPYRALDQFFRVLRPGGRVGLTTWTEDCPFLTWFQRELTDSLPAGSP